MARTFTLAQLRTKVRERADQENSTFIDDTELNGYISASYTELYDLLVRKGLAYFESTQTITADGSASYSLPTDYYGTIGVDYQYTTNEWWDIPEFMVQERNDFNFNSAGYARAYRIAGGNIVLVPTPDSGTYRHLYVPAPADLTSDSDTVDGVSGWEELIVLDATIKCYLKEETSIVQVEKIRDKMLARIEEAAENRYLTQPRRIVDTSVRGKARNWYRDRQGLGWP